MVPVRKILALTLLCWGFCQTASAEEHRFKGVCDASAAVMIDASHFIVGNDENEILSLYVNDGSSPDAIQNFDFASFLRDNIDRETDIEDAARLNNRIYWITSHGRSKKGKLRRNRYHLFATDISNAPPALELKWGGRYDHLIEGMLNAQAWDEPDSRLTTETIELIAQATQLEKKTVRKLKPKKQGLNIEALALAPDQAGLLIGFRNPLAHSNKKALVVHLKNPDALLTGNGVRAKFSAPAYIDLDGLGLRSMAYDTARKVYFIIAGSKKHGGPFKLFRWKGMHDHAPVFVRDLKHGKGAYPEVLLIHGQQLQVLNDEGRRKIGKRRCKTVNKEQRSFGEQWYDLDPVISKLEQ